MQRGSAYREYATNVADRSHIQIRGRLVIVVRPLETEHARTKSIVGHFRVCEDVYDLLEGEATEHNISLGSLVSQVLSSHAYDDAVWKEVGSVKLTKPAFVNLIKMLPDEKLAEWGGSLVETGPDSMMLERKGRIAIDSVIDVLRLFSKAGWFSVHESRVDGHDAITFIHDLGPKYSIVLRASLMELFTRVGISPRIKLTDTSVMVQY